MKVVVMARVSEDISRAEEALKADPRFRELEEYESTLRHIGGLKKGEIKPVPPWPDEKSKNQDVQ